MYIMLKFFLLHAYALSLTWGAFTYDVGFLGDQVGQAESDFTKQAYLVKLRHYEKATKFETIFHLF